MAETVDTWLIDASQALAELDKIDQTIRGIGKEAERSKTIHQKLADEIQRLSERARYNELAAKSGLYKKATQELAASQKYLADATGKTAAAQAKAAASAKKGAAATKDMAGQLEGLKRSMGISAVNAAREMSMAVANMVRGLYNFAKAGAASGEQRRQFEAMDKSIAQLQKSFGRLFATLATEGGWLKDTAHGFTLIADAADLMSIKIGNSGGGINLLSVAFSGLPSNIAKAKDLLDKWTSSTGGAKDGVSALADATTNLAVAQYEAARSAAMAREAATIDRKKRAEAEAERRLFETQLGLTKQFTAAKREEEEAKKKADRAAAGAAKQAAEDAKAQYSAWGRNQGLVRELSHDFNVLRDSVEAVAAIRGDALTEALQRSADAAKTEREAAQARIAKEAQGAFGVSEAPSLVPEMAEQEAEIARNVASAEAWAQAWKSAGTSVQTSLGRAFDAAISGSEDMRGQMAGIMADLIDNVASSIIAAAIAETAWLAGNLPLAIALGLGVRLFTGALRSLGGRGGGRSAGGAGGAATGAGSSTVAPRQRDLEAQQPQITINNLGVGNMSESDVVKLGAYLRRARDLGAA